MLSLQSVPVKLIIYVALFCSPLLALVLEIPTLSGSLKNEIQVTWKEDLGDPPTLNIKILCGRDMEKVGGTKDVKTSAFGTTISVPASFDVRISKIGPCRVRAVEPNSGHLVVATSPEFQQLFTKPMPVSVVSTTTGTSTTRASTSAMPTPNSSFLSTALHSTQSTTATPISSSPVNASTSGTPGTTSSGTVGSKKPVTTEDASTTSDLTSPQNTVLSTPPSAISASHRIAIIGGAIGGVVFLCVLVCVIIAYRRCRAGRVIKPTKSRERGEGSEIVSTLFSASPASDDRRRSTQTITPLACGDLTPQTSEGGGVQSALHETEWQREGGGFDLDAKEHPDGIGVNEEESGGRSEGNETGGERLRAGVEQMSRRITELELRLQMVQQDVDSAPPGYFSEMEPLTGS